MKYSKLVQSLWKPGKDILNTLSPRDIEILHAAIGIAGESAEVMDEIKKSVIYGKPFHIEKIVEELGDVEFYLEALRQTLDITREECLEGNIRKLSSRYTSGTYTDVDAINRVDQEAVDWDFRRG